ncbi:MAG: hemerythrin domain-containing protein [Elusimicrobia bacterium]|nr:hemerythrin domain-containing protein [Elusimicrobiota bacterium]
MNDATETIHERFEEDHGQLHALLGRIDWARPEEARAAFEAFALRLDRHIAWEEEVLFPVSLRALPGLDRRAVAALEEEHLRLRARLARTREALRAGDPAAGALGRELAAALAVHGAEEERTLYPACDARLPPAEQRRVLDVIRAGENGV